ncbi:unnamed protein product [Hydatigera taeniaeformis]|uniref:Uncharacterized protein n=1 Tax=Hydatigena taeniaeformis TaxID=6205 RepID=A0A0R3WJ67_HYDTA|nr:unnamed protein product [Hydatigera taeniaeformis]
MSSHFRPTGSASRPEYDAVKHWSQMPGNEQIVVCVCVPLPSEHPKEEEDHRLQSIAFVIGTAAAGSIGSFIEKSFAEVIDSIGEIICDIQ